MISMLWGGYIPKVREVVARIILVEYTSNLQNLREQGHPLSRSKAQRSEILKVDKTS